MMHGRKTRWSVAVGVGAAAAALLTACGSSGGAGSDQTAPSSSPQNSASGAKDSRVDFTAPTTLPVTTPISKDVPSGLKIVYVSSGVPQALTYLKGLKAAATVLGWKVESLTFDQTNPATINSTIDSALSQKPAAVVLDALLPQQYASEVPKARAAHIPLVPTVSSAQKSDGVYPVLRTQIENTYAAKILADAIAANASSHGRTAHILQITVPAFASVLGLEDKGIKDELTVKCPNCSQSLININLPDVFNGKYAQQVVSYLQSHSDINYVVSDSGQLEDGLGAALNQAGITSVTRYGFSPTNVQIKELQGGQPGAWAVQPYAVGGWQIADQVARIVVGDATDLWDGEHLVYLLDASNSKGVDPSDPEFPAGYQAMFKKLWRK